MWEIFVEFADGTEMKSQPVTGSKKELQVGAIQMASFQTKLGKDVLTFGYRPLER